MPWRGYVEFPQTYVFSHIMISLKGGWVVLRRACMHRLLPVQTCCSLWCEGCRERWSHFCLLSIFKCVNILPVHYSLTPMYVAVLRSLDLFPWKQGAGGEMATPPKWEKSRALSSVSQVSAQIPFQIIYSQA